MNSVLITKLVGGGQGMGELADGRKVFVWGVLPGETVEIELISEKSSYAEGELVTVTKPSPERIAPRDTAYLSHSPWQIMSMKVENEAKLGIVREQFTRAHIETPDFPTEIIGGEGDGYGYRNKMEYLFADENGKLSLAETGRGTHDNVAVEGSSLALPTLNRASDELLAELQSMGVTTHEVRSLVLRANQTGDVVAALYIRHPRFKKFTLPRALKGFNVYYHNPRSHSRNGAKLVQALGEIELHDELHGRDFTYDVHSFFQVNLPVYEQALEKICDFVDGPVVDMYAGVGTIGLSAAKGQATLVELDAASAAMARINAGRSGAKVVAESTERSLEYIVPDKTIIFDPPRAGLHPAVTARCLEVKPQQIIYLSCDPATLARDVARLSEVYEVKHISIYNFFPRTPHIETFVVLKLKNA